MVKYLAIFLQLRFHENLAFRKGLYRFRSLYTPFGQTHAIVFTILQFHILGNGKNVTKSNINQSDDIQSNWNTVLFRFVMMKNGQYWNETNQIEKGAKTVQKMNIANYDVINKKSHIFYDSYDSHCRNENYFHEIKGHVWPLKCLSSNWRVFKTMLIRYSD